eukprot:scaffold123782_cov49-Tisochrysis_lutea.AAC.1
MLVASSADTLQTGVAALLKPITAKALDFYKTGTSDNTRLLVSVNFVFAAAIVNIPAIVLSTAGVSVLSLFVMADLVCATCVVPLLMGLSDRTHPVAAAAGCFAGLVTALIIYLVGVNGENGDQPMRMLIQADGLYSDTSLVGFLNGSNLNAAIRAKGTAFALTILDMMTQTWTILTSLVLVLAGAPRH